MIFTDATIFGTLKIDNLLLEVKMPAKRKQRTGISANGGSSKTKHSKNVSYWNRHRYNFSSSDSSEEDEKTNCRGNNKSNENQEQIKHNLIWHNKKLQLKDTKIKIERLKIEKMLASNDKPVQKEPVSSQEFYSCTSHLYVSPKKYQTRNKSRQSNKNSEFEDADEDAPIDTNMDYDGKPHKNEEDDRNIQFLSMIEENGYEIEKIADGMADKIQLEKGGKIMSEVDEAFFWDWIISD